MSIQDCLRSAVDQGEINERQADELGRYFDARFKAGMDAKAAKQAVSEELRRAAQIKRRNAKISERKRQEIAQYLKDYRNLRGKKDLKDAALSLLVHYGTAGRSSIDGKSKAIMALAMRDLTDVMEKFRRDGLTGLRHNKADLPDLIKEMFGDSSGRPEIRAMANGIGNVMEDMRQRFNAAGGDIPKREGYDLPHSHDPARIRKLGATPEEQRAAWKQIIAPLLDADQMVNPHTGQRIGQAGLDEALDYVFETIISDGAAHISPQARLSGSGPISQRYKDGRFLEFKDADAWLSYNDQFGNNDPIGAVFSHFKSMANDIAAMEVLGPNPAAQIEWLKQVVANEYGKSKAGVANIAPSAKSLDAGKRAAYRIDALWGAMRGREVVWNKPAQFSADVRNVATAAMLGSTGQLAALTDPFIAAAARASAGLPVVRGMGKLTKELYKDARGAKGSAAAQRRAILWDDYMHTMNEEARLVDQMFGHNWSRYLVDRALTINALKPLTNARKRIEAGAWHETLGGFAQSKTSWNKLPELMRRTMTGFGFDEADWKKMRQGVDDIGFLDPSGVLDRTGDRSLAERYAEMITTWGERSVPSGDIRIKSALQGLAPRGSVTGEFLDFATQFLGFALSFTARQLEAVYMYSMLAHSKFGKIARGGRYFAALSTGLMLGAALDGQIKAINDGKDPEDMTKKDFWLKAFVRGGGGGLFADFVSRSENRFGSSFQETLSGPGMAFVGDTWDLTGGTLMKVLRGEYPKLGRKASNYLGRYTPVLSSHPTTRLAYRRMFIDNLQMLTDPDFEKSFQAKKRRHSYFVPPGEGIIPQRGPRWRNALGEGN